MAWLYRGLASGEGRDCHYLRVPVLTLSCVTIGTAAVQQPESGHVSLCAYAEIIFSAVELLSTLHALGILLGLVQVNRDK